jgi:hypothetical protein
MGLVTLLGFFSGKGAKGSRGGGLGRLIKLGVSVLPIVRLALASSRKR